MAQVSLENVTKKWGDFFGVRDCSLDIADGEFVVLLGPSGCGKTTTMRMVAGLEEPTAGRIVIGGRDVTWAQPKHRDVAMVFQSYSLYPQLTVYENIRFPLQARRVKRAEHDARVRKAAAMVELDDLLHRKPRALSGGQRQRVALARAIVRSPQVFLMDEPLSNLDARLRVSMRAQLKHLHHTLKTTTIYVTHDQIEAMTLADRVVVMSQGEVQQVGAPKEIYARPANTFVAGFIGSPAMNLIEGSLEDGAFVAPGVRVEGLTAAAGGAVALGVRPEDLSPTDPAEAPIAGDVYAVETTGEATIVTLRHGATRTIAKLDKAIEPTIGDPFGLAPAPGATHLFSVETGQRLG